MDGVPASRRENSIFCGIRASVHGSVGTTRPLVAIDRPTVHLSGWGLSYPDAAQRAALAAWCAVDEVWFNSGDGNYYTASRLAAE